MKRFKETNTGYNWFKNKTKVCLGETIEKIFGKVQIRNKIKVPHLGDLGGLIMGDLGVRNKGDLAYILTIELFLLFVMLNTTSCHRNRLKTNEKELAKELILAEKKNEEAERVAREKALADTLNQSRKGIRFKENRSIDPLHPPVIIDIAGNLNNVKEFKLSDIASGISYVRMEPVPDSTFPRLMKFKYYLLSDHIVATNPDGIILYSKDGKYLNTIVRNKTTGIVVDSDWMRVLGTNTFIGGGTSVWDDNGKLFYSYRNSISGQEYIMGYDLSKTLSEPVKLYEPENPDKILGLGEIVLNMNPSGRKPEWKYKISPELVSWGMSVDYIYQSVGTFFLNKGTYAKSMGRSDKISVISSKGDTLSAFSGFEEGNSIRFENDGKQFLWNGLNDTVFQIVGSNRIIPVLVLKLGQYKASMEEVRKIGSDLTGKIIPRQLAENRNFIFLIFSKDAYDSPNNRKTKKVKIYHALYSKPDKKLFIIKGEPLNYAPEILENNLDGGLPVWPFSYMIGNNGEILISLKGKDLKERIKSKQFKLSTAPADKKSDLKKIADSVDEEEDILMIVK